MIRIGAGAIPHQFGNDRSATTLGMLELLDHHHAGTLTHHESIAIAISDAKRGRIVIARAERPHTAEASQPAGKNTGFRTTGNHRIGIAELDDAPGFANRIIGVVIGRDDGHVRTTETKLIEKIPLPMLAIIIGMRNGDTLAPSLATSLACSFSKVPRPPMPPLTMAPMRVISRPLFAQPRRIVGHAGAAIPNWT